MNPEKRDSGISEIVIFLKQMERFNPEQNFYKLTKLGDPLEKISQKIDFEICRPILSEVFQKEEVVFENPSWDYILLFKILLLQFWHGIPTKHIEMFINDTLSIRRFLGVDLEDELPDSETVLEFCEMVTRNGIFEELFEIVITEGKACGVLTHEGKLIDSVSKNFYKKQKVRKKASDDPRSYDLYFCLKCFFCRTSLIFKMNI